ncbi:MAG: TrkH family potassium uptake protein [Clostridia bacterium]|nr:TrkH family potassium uptake protein [Clostridia bacterium]
MNYRMIKNILGWILLFETAFLIIPAITALVYREKAIFSILLTMLICASVGALMTVGKPKNKTLYSKEGIVIVSLSWIVLSAFGALPFVFAGAASYFDAFFETVSGFTTTGASIFSEVESLPKCLLIWRSFTHWIGGMGVLVFIMAFLPLSGANNMHIMKAESPGPSVSKLVPRVKTTALILYVIYFALTMALFVLLLFGGMNVFESLCTAFGTAGTGGFGTRNNSMFSFNSYIQIVVTVFMLLFSVNFASYYLVLKGKLRDALTSEIRWFFGIVISVIILISINVRYQFDTLFDTVKHVSFAVASIISTTGFSTVDFNLWPVFSKAMLLLLMFIGACAGSTGGGIKVSRIIIFFKSVAKEFRSMLHPKQVNKITVDNKPVGNEVAHSVAVYLLCYVIVFFVSVLLISFDCNSFETAFSAVAATLNNIGPGLDAVGPYANFGHFSVFSKLVLSFDMLAGRLELFPMLLLFSPSTWKRS